MEKFTFTDQKTSNPKGSQLWQLGIALFLGGSAFATLCGQLGLSWHVSSAFRGGIRSGLAGVWNQIADLLGNRAYVLLQQYAGGGEETGLFLTVCLFLLLLLAWAVLQSRSLVALGLFLVPPLLLGLFLGLPIPLGAASCLLLALFAAAVCIDSQGRMPLASVMTTLLAGLLLAGILHLPGYATFANAFSGRESLSPMADVSMRQKETGEETALVVTMASPQTMYLKGFTGDVFDGDHWSALPNPLYYENLEWMQSLEQNGFNGPGQLAQAAQATGKEVGENAIQITAQGADKDYAYVPYDLLSAGTLEDQPRKGGNVYDKGLYGSFETYQYTAADNQVLTWTQTAASLFSEASQEGSSAAPKTLTTYLENESYYNVFAYQHYTYIAPEDRITLETYFGSRGDQSQGHVDYKEVIARIRDFLDQYFLYTEKIGPAGSGTEDNVLTEFFATAKGFDAQYATAATLLFRYYGIPARYVSGYVITPEDVAAASPEGQMEISKDNLHAWTEIYIDGVGFVPMEVCPAYREQMGEADLTVGISNDSLQRTFEETEAPTEALEAVQETTPEQDRQKWKSILLALLATLLGMGLLGWLGRRGYRTMRQIQRRRRLFYQSNPKIAVSAMYQAMEQTGVPLEPETIALGNRAAYSQRPIDEEERKYMLAKWKQWKSEEKKNRRAAAKTSRKVRGSRSAGVLTLLLGLLLTLPSTLVSCGGPAERTLPEDLDAMLADVSAAVLEDTPSPTNEQVGGAWTLIGLKTAGKAPADYSQLYIDSVRAQVKASGGILSDTRYTEYDRTVMGLVVAGQDPTDVEGYDLTPYLDDYDKLTAQGPVAVSFALIAANLSGTSLTNEEAYISYLINELASGTYDSAEMVDYISMSVQGLSYYKNRPEVRATIDQAVSFLSSCQQEDGSLGSCESTVEVIIMLNLLGVNPLTDESFSKNGKTLGDGLLVYALEDGHFCHTLAQKDADKMSTEKALLGLAAIRCSQEGTKIYPEVTP